MTQQRTRIEIAKEYLHFGAAHFTIFGRGNRENLHGHNFFVEANVDCLVGEDGLAFDYNVLKDALKTQCDELDEVVLLPDTSPHLKVESAPDQVIARFGDEQMVFLPRDVKVLPVRNITVEELARYFLERLQAQIDCRALAILGIEIRVSSGPGQWAVAQWSAGG